MKFPPTTSLSMSARGLSRDADRFADPRALLTESW
jgi:hypothetical protein